MRAGRTKPGAGEGVTTRTDADIAAAHLARWDEGRAAMKVT